MACNVCIGITYYARVKEKVPEGTVDFSAEVGKRGLRGTGQQRHGNSLSSHYFQHKIINTS